MRFKKWILSALTTVMTLLVTIGIVACKKDDATKPIEEGPETGVYYYDDADKEYRIVLQKGDQVIFLVKGTNETGTYTSENGALTFTFADFTVNATYADDSLKVTYQDSQMTFLRNIEYTVSFDTNGGEAVASQTVVNGRTAKEPEMPVREGYTFYGWYEDEAYTAPFSFAAQTVRGDITLYAYWGKNGTNGSEYTVDFDLAYTAEGVTAPAAQTTNGGRLYTLETPAAREGYTFCGWWVSASGSADKLTYEFRQGETVLSEDTTLYALWAENAAGGKLPAPLLSVTENGLTWNAVNGAIGYDVYVDGNVDSVSAGENTYSSEKIAAKLDANKTEHEFKVVAKGATADKNSDAAVRYYTYNALARVSRFSVVNSMLTFEGVENAKEYYLTIVCGNADHKHENVSLGKNTFYPISGCEMKEGGIEFVVTAKADGYVSSVSRTFYYNRELAKIDELTYDADTQTVSWKAIPDAMAYIVTVKCGDNSHTVEKTNIGNATSYTLKYCSPAEGGIKFSVYPVTKGYNSPAAAELTVEKAELATPRDVTLTGTTLSWTAVPGAKAYEVKVTGTTADGVKTVTDETSCTIDNATGDVTVTIRAIAEDAANNSAWSDVFEYPYNAAVKNLAYKNGMLTWDAAFDATSYEVSVNGGSMTVNTNSASVSAKVFAGENTFRVRAAGKEWSEEIGVYFYKVTFDVNGGTAFGEGMYQNGYILLAYGDELVLPGKDSTSVKQNDEVVKELAGWYDAKGGAAVNAKKYENGTFDLASDLTLYAGWKGAIRTIILDKDADDAVLSQTTADVEYDGYTKLPVPTREGGYVFNGWYPSANGQGEPLTDAEGVTTSPWTSLAATVYASWLKVLDFTLEEDGKSYSVVAGKDISRVSEVTVPETYNGLNIDTIRAGAFKNCTTLKTINLPDTMKVIGSTTDVVSSGPFSGCKNLIAVNVYETGSIVASDANYYSVDGTLINRLAGKIRLAYVPLAKTGDYVIPDGVEEIPTRLFANSYISRVTIPSSVTRIGERAFYSSKNLLGITFADADLDADGVSVFSLEIADRAFQSCSNLREINLPKRLVKMEDENNKSLIADIFDKCSKLVSIKVATGNEFYTDMNGILCDANETAIYCPLGIEGTVTVNVKAIADGAFKARTKITKVVIPATLQSVGASAFEGCSALKEVAFDGGAMSGSTVIGEKAFYGCKVLNKVTFDEECNVTEIGKSAFANNVLLKEIKLSNATQEVGESAFADCTALKTVELLGGGAATTKFGNYVFKGCVSLAEIRLSETVDDISLSMFNGCENLKDVIVAEANAAYKSVNGVLYTKDGSTIVYCAGKNTTLKDASTGAFVLPSEVTMIGEHAFAGHKGLTKIEIAAQITEIGANAFENCSNLEELTFAARNTDLVIGNYAFANCSGISGTAKLILPANVVSVGDYAFANAGMKEIEIGANVKTIGDYAFSGSNLIAITVPATVESLGDYAFANCASLASATLELQTEKLIGTFSGCALLGNVSVQEGLLTIGEGAFANAGKNAEGGLIFEIPSSVQEIGKNAFNASGILSVTIPAKVPAISAGAFMDTEKLTSITFEKTAEGDEKVALVIEGESQSTGAFANSALTAIELPERLTSIGGYAFYSLNVSKLTSVTSEKTTGDLTEIGNYAFSGGQNIAVLELPEGLKTIGANAFWKNNKLTSLVLPASLENIKENAFSDGKFATLSFAKGGSGELTIENKAFADCYNLTSVEFPLTLKELGTRAFDGCSAIAEYKLQKEDGKTNQFGFGEKAETPGILYLYDGETFVNFYIPANYSGFYGENGEAVAFKIPDEITVLPEYTFYASRIKKVDLNNVTEIQTSAFEASELTEIEIGLNVTTLGSRAFYGCTQLASLTFEKAATEAEEENYTPLVIGAAAYSSYGVFEGDTNLVSVELPKRLTVLGMNTFKKCSALKTLTFEERANIGTEITKDFTIGSGAFESTAFTTLVLPEGLTTVSKAYSKSKIQQITIPASVTEIESRAFYGVTALTKVTFAKGGTEDLVIRYEAFRGCTGLTSFELPARTTELGYSTAETSKGSVFYGCTKLTSFTLEKVTDEATGEVKTSPIETLYNKMFYNCSALTSVELPETITALGNVYGSTYSNSYSPFYGCKKLANMVIPDSVDTVQDYLFYNCSGLKSVTLSANMTEFPSNLFSGCTALAEIKVSEGSKNFSSDEGVLYDNVKESLIFYPQAKTGTSYTLPSTVKTIKTGAMGRGSSDYPKNLTTLTLPKSVTTIEYRAFYYNKKLATLTIPADGALESIAEEAFYNATALKALNVPASVEEIGKTAFRGCTALATLTFDDGSKTLSIGEYAFYGCSNTNFKTLKLPARLSVLGGNSFNGCSKLTSVDMSSCGVQTIGASAFRSCTNLATVEFPANVVTIERYAFASSGLTSAVMPASVTTMEDNVFSGCAKLATFRLTPDANGNYAMVSFGTWDSGSKIYYNYAMFSGCKLLNNVELPDCVTMIGESMFNGCAALTNITVPAGITAIGKNAFNGTAITSFDIPDTVTEIGEGAFRNCTKLESVTLNEYTETLTSIGANAFNGCVLLENFTVPASVQTLGADAFKGCAALVFDLSPDSANYVYNNGVLTDADFTSILYIDISKTYGDFVLPDALTAINDNAFEGTHFNKVTLSENLTSIGKNAFKNSEVKEIVWNDKLQTIGESAFEGTQLASATIAKSVTQIGNKAFQNVKTLTSLTFEKGGASALKIGNYAFYGTSVTSVDFPNRIRMNGSTPGIGMYCFDGVETLTEITFEPATAASPAGAMNIGDYAFRGTTLVNLEIPEYMGSTSQSQYGSGHTSYYPAIGKGSFMNCEKLETIDFGTPATSSYYYLGQSAFENCTSLGKNGEALVLPDTVYFSSSSTGSYAFRYCTSLKEVIFSGQGGATSGASSVFEGCTSLEKATLTGKGTAGIVVGSSWFKGCYNLKEINLPDTLSAICANAFNGCTSLTSITLPAACVKVVSTAFTDCTALTGIEVDPDNRTIRSVDGVLYQLTDGEIKELILYPTAKPTTEFVIPEKVTTLGARIFKGNTSLRKVTILGDVRELGSSLFSGCTSLEEVVLPSKLQTITNSAFEGCTSLKSIDIPDSVTTIQASAFKNSGLTSVALPVGLSAFGSESGAIDAAAFAGCADLADISFKGEGTNNLFTIEGGVLYADGGKTVVLYPAAKEGTAFAVPAAVTKIEDSAFYGAKNLTSVSFEAATALDTIEDEAFMNCTALQSVSLTAPLTSFGGSVFSGCTALKTVDFAPSVANLEVGSKTFENCSALTSATFNGNVAKVGSNLFLNCSSLTSFTIPVNMIIYSTISSSYSSSYVYNAFIGCTSLTEINVEEGSTEYASEDGILYSANKTMILYVPANKSFATVGGLSTFTIPDSVQRLASGAFYSNQKVQKVVFGKGINQVDSSLFRDCAALKEVDMSAATGLTSLSSSFFVNCAAIEKVILPESVTALPMRMFDGCGLKEFAIPSTVATVGNYAFTDCTSLKKVFVPKEITDLGTGAFNEFTEDQAIYIEAASQPSGWDADWTTGCKAKIKWGATKADYEANVLFPQA